MQRASQPPPLQLYRVLGCMQDKSSQIARPLAAAHHRQGAGALADIPWGAQPLPSGSLKAPGGLSARLLVSTQLFAGAEAAQNVIGCCRAAQRVGSTGGLWAPLEQQRRLDCSGINNTRDDICEPAAGTFKCVQPPTDAKVDGSYQQMCGQKSTRWVDWAVGGWLHGVPGLGGCAGDHSWWRMDGVHPTASLCSKLVDAGSYHSR
jgi:hypothetical protein